MKMAGKCADCSFFVRYYINDSGSFMITNAGICSNPSKPIPGIMDCNSFCSKDKTDVRHIKAAVSTKLEEISKTLDELKIFVSAIDFAAQEKI